jgi:hypothetical protein
MTNRLGTAGDFTRGSLAFSSAHVTTDDGLRNRLVALLALLSVTTHPDSGEIWNQAILHLKEHDQRSMGTTSTMDAIWAIELAHKPTIGKRGLSYTSAIETRQTCTWP